jgi:hypothetical protein
MNQRMDGTLVGPDGRRRGRSAVIHSQPACQ